MCLNEPPDIVVGVAGSVLVDIYAALDADLKLAGCIVLVLDRATIWSPKANHLSKVVVLVSRHRPTRINDLGDIVVGIVFVDSGFSDSSFDLTANSLDSIERVVGVRRDEATFIKFGNNISLCVVVFTGEPGLVIADTSHLSVMRAGNRRRCVIPLEKATRRVIRIGRLGLGRRIRRQIKPLA